MMTQEQSIVYEAQPKVQLDEFVPDLAFEFPDVPTEAFANYLLRVITKFAIASNALRRKAVIHIQPCVENYLLEPIDCMEVLAVMGVREVRANCCSGPVHRLTTNPVMIGGGVQSWFEAPNTIWFQPAKRPDVYEVIFSVKPTYDACEVDRILLTDYYDVIADGLRALLYNMPDKPWSTNNRQPALASSIAEKYELKFRLGCHDAAIQTMMGGQRGALRAKRPRVL